MHPSRNLLVRLRNLHFTRRSAFARRIARVVASHVDEDEEFVAGHAFVVRSACVAVAVGRAGCEFLAGGVALEAFRGGLWRGGDGGGCVCGGGFGGLGVFC